MSVAAASLRRAIAVRATPQPRAGGHLPAFMRSGQSQRVLLVIAAATALALVAIAQGLLPGMIAGATISYWGEASVQCTHDLGLHALTTRCHAFAEPVGFPLLTGGPTIALAALLMYLPGVDSLGALILSQLAFVGLGMAGIFGLMRRLGAGPWVALGTATAWGLSPTLVGLTGFGGTYVGYALLPAYAFADLVAIDALERRRGFSLAGTLLAYATVRTGALFMDGYSFIGSGLVSVSLWVAWLVPRRRLRLRGAAVLIGANVIAYAAYRLYVPVDYEASPDALFRAMSLDLATLVAPSNDIWFASKLGIAADHARLWGDTTNSMFNYTGFVGVGLAAWFLVRRWRSPIPSALAVAGAIALVLSFGPVVKFDVARTPGADVYDMPAAAAPALPWGAALDDVPGLKSIRATYRWYAVSRMALIVLAGLAVAELARGPGRRRQIVALSIAAVAVAEVLPTVPLFVRGYRANYDDRVAVRSEVVPELERASADGERVFFLSYDGAHNDFLANYLAAAAGLRAYNAGGDKNSGYAMRNWPPEVSALTSGEVAPEAIERALRSRKVDVVVAPFFHLHANSATWPPSPQQATDARRAFARVLRSRRFDVKRGRWLATIRRRA